MITIIHGTNIAASRKYFTDLRQNIQNALFFEGNKITLSDLTQALEGQGLFGGDSQIFIEELLSKRKASKDLEKLVTYLTQQSEQNIIVLWESKELTTKQINAFGKPAVKKFDIPKEVFAFLDSLLPNNSKQTITLFHRVLYTEDPEFVFFMIVRQFRIMLGSISSEKGWHGGKASEGAQTRLNRGSTDGKEPVTGLQTDEQIDELKRLAPWQKSKLTKQAAAFGIDKLLEHYEQLFVIESGIKTGQLPGSVEQTIDMFLLNL